MWGESGGWVGVLTVVEGYEADDWMGCVEECAWGWEGKGEIEDEAHDGGVAMSRLKEKDTITGRQRHQKNFTR